MDRDCIANLLMFVTLVSDCIISFAFSDGVNLFSKDTKVILGTCFREEPKANIICYFRGCSLTYDSSHSLETHIKKDHLSDQAVEFKYHLFPSTGTPRSASSETGSSRSRSASLAPTALASVEIESQDNQELSPASPSEDSSPAVSRSPSRGRTMEPELDGEQASSWTQTLRPSRSASLRQSLPKLNVRSTPYPMSQPTSRNVSPEKRPTVAPVAPSPLHQVAFTARVSPPSRSPEEMNVDAEQESGSEAALRAAGLKVLDLRKCNIDTNLSVIVCVTCQGGVHPKSPIIHAQSHGIKLTKQHISDLNKLIPTLRLASETKDFSSPPNDQAPIDDIQIHKGLQYNSCSYACRMQNPMDNHWSRDHRAEGSPDFSDCKVQTIFASKPKYFTVLPALKGLASDDMYRLYLSQFVPEIALADKVIVPPISDKEVPPLLRVTLWHEHLQPFTKDKASVRDLRWLVDTAYAEKKTPWLGKPLYTTVSFYMQDIRRKMKKTLIPALMLLMKYPV